MKIIFAVLIITASFALAVVVFFVLRRIIYNMIDRRIERFQSGLIEKQVREIQNMYKQVRGFRHDYRNHIQNMRIQLKNGNYEELDKYLFELSDDLNSVDTVIKTGNVMADAILNSKLSIAEKMDISINVKASVPMEIPMSDVELCALMGNLLDNAVEACAKIPSEKRFLRVYIGKIKNQFYMSVQNSSGGIKKLGGMYISTKSDKDSHGYGIFRIDRIAKKYGGYINRQNEEGVFATEISIPLLT